MAHRWRPVCFAALVALFALVPAGPAFAKKAKKAPPDRVFAGQNAQGMASFIKFQNAKGTKISAVFSFRITCGDATALSWNGVSDIPVKKNKFKFDRPENADGPEVHLAGTIGKRAVKGTWRVAIADTDPNDAQQGACDTGQVGFTLPRSGYGGQMSNGYPVVLIFNKARTKVELMTTLTPIKCQTNTDGFAVLLTYGNFPVISSGVFGDEFDDNADRIQADPDPTFHVKVSGKVGKTKAKGTWQLQAQMKDQAGTVVDNCDSGPLTWSATM